jgi:nicotinate-nucleotide adenylyltransferase
MKRLGIFGGSFNPVHHGHLIAAQDALEAFALDRVLFVPCAQPPHKPAAVMAPAADRRAMLELAIADNPRFELCTLELDRGGVSYTVDTLRALRERHPGETLAFIIGVDTLSELHTWRAIGEVLEMAEIVTLIRPGTPPERWSDAALGLPPPWPERLRARMVHGHAVEISSSDVRRRLAEGREIRYFVPPRVEQYLRARRMYTHG